MRHLREFDDFSDGETPGRAPQDSSVTKQGNRETYSAINKGDQKWSEISFSSPAFGSMYVSLEGTTEYGYYLSDIYGKWSTLINATSSNKVDALIDILENLGKGGNVPYSEIEETGEKNNINTLLQNIFGNKVPLPYYMEFPLFSEKGIEECEILDDDLEPISIKGIHKKEMLLKGKSCIDNAIIDGMSGFLSGEMFDEEIQLSDACIEIKGINGRLTSFYITDKYIHKA